MKNVSNDELNSCVPDLARRVLIIAVALALVISQDANCQTFKQSVEIAITNSKILSAELERGEIANESRIQAENIKRPNIQLEGGLGLSSNGQWLGPYGSKEMLWRGTEPIDGSIVLSQPLLTGGRYKASKREAEIRIAQQKSKFNSLKLQTAQQVLVAYCDVLRDFAINEARAEGISNLEKQLEATKARNELGLIGKTDVAQVQTRLAAARGQAASAHARLASSWLSLTRYLGEEPSGLIEREIVVELPNNRDDTLLIAKRNNLDMKIAWFNEDLARANSDIIKTEIAPKVSLNVSSGYSLDSGINGARSIDNQLNLKITVPIWNGGQNSSRVRSALNEANAFRFEALDLERQLTEKVLIGWESYLAASENESFANDQVQASQVAREGTELEQRIGSRTTLDVLNQEQELLDAKVNLLNAKREKMVSAINLSILMGLDPTNTININDLNGEDQKIFSELKVYKFGIPTRWERPLVKLFDAMVPLDGAVKRNNKELSRILGNENK